MTNRASAQVGGDVVTFGRSNVMWYAFSGQFDAMATTEHVSRTLPWLGGCLGSVATAELHTPLPEPKNPA